MCQPFIRIICSLGQFFLDTQNMYHKRKMVNLDFIKIKHVCYSRHRFQKGQGKCVVCVRV